MLSTPNYSSTKVLDSSLNFIKDTDFKEPVYTSLSNSRSSFNINTDELVSFELKNVAIPAQSSVANVIVNLDYKAGVDESEFRNILPIADFVKNSLTNSRNPNEFYEIINKNLTTSLLNNSSFDLASVLDFASVTLDVAPNSNLPFTFKNTVTVSSDGTTDQLVSFELEDVAIPAQSGVADVTVNLDYKAGVDDSEFRNILPIADFVKNSLTNFQNPNEFYEVINRKLTTSLLNNSSFDLASVLDFASVTLDVAPNSNLPFTFKNTVTALSDGTTDQLVSFELEDVTIPAQSSIADVTVNLDYKAGVDDSEFRNILPIADFVKNSLTNSQNPNEFYEVINRKLTTSLLNNSSFDLASVLDFASVTLDVAPNSNLPFTFKNTVTALSDGTTDQLVSFELEDVAIPAQSSVANVIVNLDYKAGVDDSEFRNILPIADFVKNSLTNSQNANEFYEIINKNLTTSLLNDSSLDLASVLDSASVKLDVAPNSNLPFKFNNTVTVLSDTVLPNSKTDELVSFELEDVAIPAQSSVADVTVNLDYKAGVDDSEFRNILPIADFVKNSLINSRNPNEFYEVINRNLTTSLLNNSSFNLASVLDFVSVTLDVEPNSNLPFTFKNTVTALSDGTTDQLVSFELEDVTIPAQSSIADVTVNLDYKAGVDDSEFRNILPIADFVKNSLTNSRNPNEFYEVINRKLAKSLLNDSSLDLASVLDSASVTLDVEPNSNLPFPFVSTVTVTPH